MNLDQLINYARLQRGFEIKDFLKNKIKKINKFFSDNKLDSCVVGLSGGIDSTVVLYLLAEAANAKNSPIKRIVGLSLPIRNSVGVTNQDTLIDKINLIRKDFSFNSKVEIHHMDFMLSSVSQSYDSWFRTELEDKYEYNPWNKGQLDSILRTPAFYYMAALLQTLGYKSIVCGTTNRDEGEYIGFYGKASDGMNDLQPIGDMHKSEVFKLAIALKCPQVIIDAPPRGDVWDNKSDLELIGAPYDFLEAYVILKFNRGFHQDTWASVYQLLDEETKQKVDLYVENIEKNHQTNLHKYYVGRPSHYIDVMQRIVHKH